MTDNFPIGTIAGPGRPVQAFRGRINQIPSGWVLADGRTLQPHEHEHPNKRGRPWKLPDLRRQFISGTSTHIESMGDDDGSIASVQAATPEMPGIYALVKVRSN